jgi:hypothetical protein
LVVKLVVMLVKLVVAVLKWVVMKLAVVVVGGGCSDGEEVDDKAGPFAASPAPRRFFSSVP